MVNPEQWFITLPMFGLLIGLAVYELRTDIIPDKVIFPTAIYLLAARSVIGPEPWWHYPTSFIMMLLFFIASSFAIETIWKVESIGGGAIKLMAVMGAALGFYATFHFGILFSAVILLAVLIGPFFNLSYVPSSIYALLSYSLIISFDKFVHRLI